MQGQEEKALSQVFEVQGRPGMVPALLIPAGVQFLLANYCMNTYDRQVMAWVMYVFNFIIYFLVLRAIYFLCLNLDFVLEWRLLVLVLYTVTANGYLTLRHVTPLDISLLLSLCAYYLLLKNNFASYQSIILQGLLNVLSILVYPGYYCLFISFLMVLFWRHKDSFFHGIWWKKAVLFSLSFLIPLVLVEILAKSLQTSYITELYHLGQTITQGSFDEGFTFVFRYFWQVESWVGIAYLAGLFFFFLFIKRSISNSKGAIIIYVVLISVSLSFLGYCLMVFIVQKMLFTGRVLHQFLPFFCIAAVKGYSMLIESKQSAIKHIPIISIGLFISSMPVYFDYYNVEYPWDFYRKAVLQKGIKTKRIDYHCQWFQCLWRGETATNADSPSYKSLILVNWCHPSNSPPSDGRGWNKFIPLDKQILVASAPHYISFVGYHFEGANPEQRKALAEYPPELMVYEVQSEKE